MLNSMNLATIMNVSQPLKNTREREREREILDQFLHRGFRFEDFSQERWLSTQACFTHVYLKKYSKKLEKHL